MLGNVFQLSSRSVFPESSPLYRDLKWAGFSPAEGGTKSLWRRSSGLDVCVTQDDERYFTKETDDISNLETSVLESPRDVQLWIKLAYKYLNQKER